MGGPVKKKRLNKKSATTIEPLVAAETVLDEISYATTSTSGSADVVSNKPKKLPRSAGQSKKMVVVVLVEQLVKL